MLRVTIEIVPWGVESQKRHVGTLHIARTTMKLDPENYAWTYYGHDGCFRDSGRVTAHYYAEGAWELARRAIECLIMPELR